MERYMVHSTTGEIIIIDGDVFRRILTAASFNLNNLPDRTPTENKAIESILKIQYKYPELI